MGCFFGCFRVKDSNSNVITPSERVISRSKNALSSLFVCDEDQSVGKREEGRKELPRELDVREIENEAKSLKCCGTLPVEIRETLDKWEDKSAQNGEDNCSRFSSSMEELKLEKQFDESPAPAKIREEWATGSPSPVDSPSSRSCLTDGLSSGGVSSVQGIHKSLHSDCDSNNSDCVSQSSNHLRKPIKINDEDNLMLSTPVMKLAVKSHSVGEDVKNEESLSSWFKPVSAKKEANNKGFGEKVPKGRTPGDRPILGMVAAHWNDDNETSRISPKWWDGNGIPNSTNKYKEDQKVSWHATPFEERLEKALSEETFISQRKRINGTPPLELDETEEEESDTALSHMQSSSAHIKSVVSF